MAKNNEFEIVLFGRKDLDDFRDYILENIFDELFLLDEFDEAEVIGLGAVIGEEPVGAAIVSLFDNNVVYLNSIAVAEELFRQGIGTALLDGAVRTAYQRFASFAGEDAERVNISLLTDYFAEENSFFEAFLTSYGFSKEEEDEEQVWLIPYTSIEASGFLSPALAEDYSSPEGIFSMADAAGEYADAIAGYLEMGGSTAEIDYSFFTGTKEEPKGLVAFSYGADDSFIVSSQCTEACTEEDFQSMLLACIHSAKKNQPEFELCVSSAMNDLPENWEKCDFGNDTQKFAHRRAHLYLTVE